MGCGGRRGFRMGLSGTRSRGRVWMESGGVRDGRGRCAVSDILTFFWPFGAVDLVYFLIIIGTSFTFDVELIHSTFRVPMWLFRLWPLTKSIPRLGYSNNLP